MVKLKVQVSSQDLCAYVDQELSEETFWGFSILLTTWPVSLVTGKDPVGVASHKGVLPHRQNRVKMLQEVKSLFLKGKNTEYAFNLVLKINSAALSMLPTPSH